MTQGIERAQRTQELTKLLSAAIAEHSDLERWVEESRVRISAMTSELQGLWGMGPVAPTAPRTVRVVPRKLRTPVEGSKRSIVLAYMKEHPGLHYTAYLTAVGMDPTNQKHRSSIRGMLSILQKEGRVHGNRGHWKLTSNQPPSGFRQKLKRTRSHKNIGARVTKQVVDILSRRPEGIEGGQVVYLVNQEFGMRRGTAWTALTQLFQQGIIVRTGKRGEYIYSLPAPIQNTTP